MPAYYSSNATAFLNSPEDKILGQLTAANTLAGFSTLESCQIEAWQEEAATISAGLRQLQSEIPSSSDWGILLEFPIPRRQQRVDLVLLARDVICVVEFKTGFSDQSWSATRQVEDYALDLADFHEPSRNRVIVPIIVGASDRDTPFGCVADSNGGGAELGVKPVLRVAPAQLGAVLAAAYRHCTSQNGEQIDCEKWNWGVYRPVPTIIEAATALYAGMSIREITHCHSGLHNLTQTTESILRIVEAAQRAKEKVLCFVTGIPGAGKTLAGLNLVHSHDVRADGRPASVFMSGNGPLVDILREALAVDSADRTGRAKKSTRREVRTFIQNVHHFVQDNLDRDSSQPPYEHAVVFDEAQRAWNAEQNKKKYRKRPPRWHVSEPEMVLSIMDRHEDWAVVVALVGGGQEIHSGEAGLSEWGLAIAGRFPSWKVIASPEALDGGESVAGGILFGSRPEHVEVLREDVLHLRTCVRSHRAEALATWVNRVLEGRSREARGVTSTFDGFPILLTRGLDQAKQWLRDNTRGERRCGLVASSGAARLRAYGIETSKAIRDAYSYPQWFLARQGDVRSSYQLEMVATEFEIQGLELDNVGVCWGGDLVWDSKAEAWTPSEFRGTRWRPARAQAQGRYTENKYRVLLTRAREGLLIWIPQGDDNDPTRSVSAMESTADYLLTCGATALD